jgi:hypothetical protein
MTGRRAMVLPLLLSTLLAGHDPAGARSAEPGAALRTAAPVASRPDLAIDLRSAEPEWPRNNTKITVTIRNAGDAPAPKADCRVILRQAHAPRKVIRTIKKTVRALGAGDRYEFAFTVKVGLGMFEAAATVDRKNKIAETDETNNTAKILIIGE